VTRLRKTDPNAFLSPAKSPEAFAADVAELRRVLSYEPSTGELRWTAEAGPRGPAGHGAIAGCIRPLCGGYRWISVNYIQWRAHVLAWVHVHGSLPDGQIDHRNGNPEDNRLSNLRVVTNRTNSQNQRKPRADNTTGYLGVSLDKRRGKFGARIRVPDGRYLFLGYFDAPDAAHAAYIHAKRRLHEGCTL
jgi:hypothetical protein